VTETLLYGSATETLTYVANDSNNGTYFLAHDLKTFDTRSANARSYGFTVIDGILTSLAEGRGVAGSTQTVDVTRLAATAFAINGDTITETSVQENVVETLTFVARDGSSYHLAPSLKTFISAGDATTMLFVESTERMTFTLSDDAVTAAMTVRPDRTLGTAHAPGGVMTYSVAAEGYVVEILNDGTNAHYEVYYDGNGDGIIRRSRTVPAAASISLAFKRRSHL
jgi:hypothetical protein